MVSHSRLISLDLLHHMIYPLHLAHHLSCYLPQPYVMPTATSRGLLHVLPCHTRSCLHLGGQYLWYVFLEDHKYRDIWPGAVSRDLQPVTQSPNVSKLIPRRWVVWTAHPSLGLAETPHQERISSSSFSNQSSVLAEKSWVWFGFPSVPCLSESP